MRRDDHGSTEQCYYSEKGQIYSLKLLSARLLFLDTWSGRLINGVSAFFLTFELLLDEVSSLSLFRAGAATSGLVSGFPTTIVFGSFFTASSGEGSCLNVMLRELDHMRKNPASMVH